MYVDKIFRESQWHMQLCGNKSGEYKNGCNLCFPLNNILCISCLVFSITVIIYYFFLLQLRLLIFYLFISVEFVVIFMYFVSSSYIFYHFNCFYLFIFYNFFICRLLCYILYFIALKAQYSFSHFFFGITKIVLKF